MMTKEEAVNILNGYMSGRIDAESTELYHAIELVVDILELQPSLSSNLDEAAEEYAYNNWEDNDYHTGASEGLPFDAIGHAEKCFKAGAEWMAGQGWIDDGSMPPETKYEEDTMQGHREWTGSEPVLAWDSMYGPRVDVTKNGKWMSEQRGGYTGQVCHGIIAWRPIPEYKEKQ